MAEAFVPNQNFDDAIAAKAPEHVFSAVMEPWLGQPGALDCLHICSLSPGQANGWNIGQGFDEMIFFTDIRPDEVQGIGKIIMAATTATLRINQPYRRLNNINALVH